MVRIRIRRNESSGITVIGRYGITDYGLRRNNITNLNADTTTSLQAGDALILFASDKTVGEITGLFSHPQD